MDHRVVLCLACRDLDRPRLPEIEIGRPRLGQVRTRPPVALMPRCAAIGQPHHGMQLARSGPLLPAVVPLPRHEPAWLGAAAIGLSICCMRHAKIIPQAPATGTVQPHLPPAQPVDVAQASLEEGFARAAIPGAATAVGGGHQQSEVVFWTDMLDTSRIGC